MEREESFSLPTTESRAEPPSSQSKTRTVSSSARRPGHGEGFVTTDAADAAAACCSSMEMATVVHGTDAGTGQELSRLAGAKNSLFPPAAECVYTKCYCEETVWKLCEYVKIHKPEELPYCYCIFISNEKKAVPIWRQKIKEGDDPVVWDYHVVFLWRYDKRTMVYDLDTKLPFPYEFEHYISEAIRTDDILLPDFHRWFRVIEADTYLKHFASDRRHMLDEKGQWQSPPPLYPCISTPESTNSIQDFISMDPSVGWGRVVSLADFVDLFALPFEPNS